LMGIPRQGPYSAAKAAVRLLIDAARVELAPEGLRFTSLYPGFVATARANADGLPKPFQISEKAAARHVIRALRRARPARPSRGRRPRWSGCCGRCRCPFPGRCCGNWPADRIRRAMLPRRGEPDGPVARVAGGCGAEAREIA
jgi:NAD(P)-dependent dehydrogenase (short-subunit alcohol dehydrogenase family)